MAFGDDIAGTSNRPQYIAEIDIQDSGTLLEGFTFTRVTATAPTYSPGYALINGFEATAGWSATGDAATIATSTTSVEGTNSISFAKTGTTGTGAGIMRTVTLDWSAVQRFRVALHIPDAGTLAKIASARIRLDESGGAFTTESSFTVAVAHLAVGWNWIEFSPNRPTSTTGSPTRAAIDRIEFGIITTVNADTFTLVKFDDLCTLDYGYTAVGDATFPQGVHEYCTTGDTAIVVSKQGTALTCGISFVPTAALDVSGYDALGYDLRVPTVSDIASAHLKLLDTDGYWSIWDFTRQLTAGWNSPRFDVAAEPTSKSGTLNKAAVTSGQLYLTFNNASDMMTDIVFDRLVGWYGPSIITSHDVTDLSDSMSLQNALSIPGSISQKAQPEAGKTTISGVSFTVVDRKISAATLDTASDYDYTFDGTVEPPAATPSWTLSGVDHATAAAGLLTITGAGTDLSSYSVATALNAGDFTTVRASVKVAAGFVTRDACTLTINNRDNCFVRIDMIDGKIYVSTETSIGIWFEDAITYDTTSDQVILDAILDEDGHYFVWIDGQCQATGKSVKRTPVSSGGRITIAKLTTASESHDQVWDYVSWRVSSSYTYPMMRCVTLNELRGRRVRLLMGFPGYKYDDYHLIDTYRITSVAYEDGQYTIGCDNDLAVMKQPCMPTATKSNTVTITANIITIWLQMLTSTGNGTNGAYDVLPEGYGIGFPVARLDLAQIEYERDTWLNLWDCEITFSDIVKDFKDWADAQIFKVCGAILRVKNGLVQIKARRVPLSADTVYEIDEQNLSEDKSNWLLDTKDVYNRVIFKYNKDVENNEYDATGTYNASSLVMNDKTSQELFGVKLLEISADCVQSTISTAMLASRASAIFQRYASGPIEIKAGFPLAAIEDVGLGDPVIYSNWQHPNAGTYGYDEILMEVKEISVDHVKGDIDVVLVRSGYVPTGDTRYVSISAAAINFDYDSANDAQKLAHGWIADSFNLVGTDDDTAYAIAP